MAKSELKVVSIIFGLQPSSFVRAITRGKVASELLVDWTTIDLEADWFISKAFRKFKYSRPILRAVLIPLNLLRNARDLKDADVIYVVKFPPLWLSLVIKYFCKVVIYDFDDPMWLKQFTGARKFKIHLKCYNGFTCDNELQLFRGAQVNSQGIVIDGIVPSFDGFVPTKQTGVNIIWLGSHSTQMYLQSIQQALMQVVDSRDFVSLKLLGVDPSQIVFDNSRVRYLEYYNEAQMQHELCNADIGIFPLFDDELSNARGVHKLNVYFAAGIPVVAASNLLIHKALKPGLNGYTCNSIEDWSRVLLNLIDNEVGLLEMKNRILLEFNPIDRNYESTLKLINFFRETIKITQSR